MEKEGTAVAAGKVPNEAHNGYLETIVELGLIGVFLLIAMLVATFRKIRLELLQNFEWGRYRLGFFTAGPFYNWTEAAFGTYSCNLLCVLSHCDESIHDLSLRPSSCLLGLGDPKRAGNSCMPSENVKSLAL